MKSLNEKYETVLREQDAPADSEDNRRAGLSALSDHVKQLNIAKEQARKYTAAIDEFNNIFQILKHLSRDSLLKRYARKLDDNADNVSEEESDFLNAFHTLNQDQLHVMVRDNKLSPLD
jgi:putative cell wall-binding protein